MLECAPMPRGLFRKITPRSETLRTHWALKPFGRFFGDPRLWSLQRRTVTPGVWRGPRHLLRAAAHSHSAGGDHGDLLPHSHSHHHGDAAAGESADRSCRSFCWRTRWACIVTGAPPQQFPFRDELGMGAERPGADVETFPRGLWPDRRIVRPGGLGRCSTCCGATTCARDIANARRPPATNQPRSTRFPRSSSRMRSMRAASRRSCVTTMRLVAEFAVQFEHQREHRFGIAAIEISGGLVGQHDARIGHERARHRGALAFAARQFVRPVDQALAETHALAGSRARCFPPPAAARAAPATASPRFPAPRIPAAGDGTGR